MKRRVLNWIKVSELPDPPPGDEKSLTTFRASKKDFYLSVILWLPKQISAVTGLVFALVFFGSFDIPFINIGIGDSLVEFLGQFRQEIGGVTIDPISLIKFLELLAIATFAVQLVFSLVMLKLSWELRWYMVGDQALRIREGLWVLREQTVTIANIQNMTVKQGPLQKLLGIATLEVQTAGGGSSMSSSDPMESAGPLHIARFRGVEDAQALRHRIQKRLMAFKGAGLGDAEEPEDELQSTAQPSTAPRSLGLAEAAAELRDEARALRQMMTASHA